MKRALLVTGAGVFALLLALAPATPAADRPQIVTETEAVQGPLILSVSVGPQSPSVVVAGHSASYFATAYCLKLLGICTGATATFSITTPLPPGVHYSFNPPQPKSSGSDCTAHSTLTITTSAFTPAGNYALTVRAANSSTDWETRGITLRVSPEDVPPVPDVNPLPTIVGECSASIAAAPTATDNVSGKITGTTPDPWTYTAQGTYTVHWTYTDAAGNQSHQNQTVIVSDVTAPLVTLAGDDPMTVECHTTFTDPGASANDNCDGVLPVTPAGAVTVDVPGAYVLTYQATDAAGHHGSATRTVNVVDTTPPAISVSVTPVELWPPNHRLVGVHATVAVGDACDAAPAVALQAVTLTCGGDPWLPKDPARATIVGADLGTADYDFQLLAEKSPNGGCDPTYTIVYTATDGAGNSAAASATVGVPHDQRGTAFIAGGDDPGGMGAGTASFALVIPSLVRAPLAEDGEPADRELGAAGSIPVLLFDARKVAPDQIWLGTSRALVAPSSVEARDANGDGFADLVVGYEAVALGGLAGMPVDFEDPITLYYRIRAGSGWEAAVALPAALAEPAARSGAPAVAATLRTAAGGVPHVTQLGPARPNPASSTMTVALDLARDGEARIEVYDLRGALVRTLIRGTLAAGRYQVAWDGSDESGRRVANGVYLVRAEAGSYHVTHKAVFVR